MVLCFHVEDKDSYETFEGEDSDEVISTGWQASMGNSGAYEPLLYSINLTHTYAATYIHHWTDVQGLLMDERDWSPPQIFSSLRHRLNGMRCLHVVGICLPHRHDFDTAGYETLN